MIISDGSDVEEMAPPLIPFNPTMSTNEATIATLPSPNSTQIALFSPPDISPAEVTGLFSCPPPNEMPGFSLHPPPLPSLAAPNPNLEEEELQVHWDFKKDQGQAAKVAEALQVVVRAWHQKHKTTNLWVQG